MARILIADDNADARELYRIVFVEEGHEVILAGDGETAVRMAREERPDLAILDIGMPEKTGLEALREIMEVNGGIPVIVNTAYPLFRMDFRAHMAREWLTKSSNLEPLKQAVRKHLPKT